MIALFFVLASSPLDPLWVLVDEERYDAAIQGAVQVASKTENPEKLRQDALSLALSAACSGPARRCAELASRVADWAPTWRPDSRAMPRLVQAVGQARLTRQQRHASLAKGDIRKDRWCGPQGTHEILMITKQGGLKAQTRTPKPCVSLGTTQEAYLLALDHALIPLAAHGSPDALRSLNRNRQASTPLMTYGIILGSAAVVAGFAYVLLLAEPGSGQIELTVVRP
jgi:hypothetical protein